VPGGLSAPRSTPAPEIVHKENFNAVV